MRGISNDLKKLRKYFNGATTFTFNLTIPPITSLLPNKLTLYLKELEVLTVKSAIVLASGGSSRLYC